MLRPIFKLSETIIKSIAKDYVKSIKIDSIPLWKGEVIVDDFSINAEGLNKIMNSANSPVSISEIKFSRLQVGVPVFSPGTKPLRIDLHSLALQLSIKENNENRNIESKDEKKEKKKDEEEKKSFVSKLLSNILLSINGLTISINVFGIQIELVVSNFEVLLSSSEKQLKIKNLRGSISKSSLSISLLCEFLHVIRDKTKTSIDVNDIRVSTTSPFCFTLLEKLTMKCVIMRSGLISISSHDPIKIAFDISILPSIVEIINQFAAPKTEKYSSFPEMLLLLRGISLRVVLSDKLTMNIEIRKIKLNNGQISIKEITLLLMNESISYYLIEPISIKGSLNLVGISKSINIFFPEIRVSFPLTKEIIDNIKKISIVIPSAPVFPPIKYRSPNEKTSFFHEISKISINKNVVTLELDDRIIINSFSFTLGLNSGDNVLLRVWDPSFKCYITFASFEINEKPYNFALNTDQLIPISKFQLVFPKNLEITPEKLNQCSIHHYCSESISSITFFNISIEKLLITAESFDFPTFAVSLNELHLLMSAGSFGDISANFSFGLTLMLANFRNGTLSSIIDIPSISAMLSSFPNYSDILSLPKSTLYRASILQESYSANCKSLSMKIPNFNFNTSPTILSDFVKYATSLSPKNAIAYHIQNKSDSPFVYQISTSQSLMTILPEENHSISFLPYQVHYIFFPSQSTKVFLNEPNNYYLSDTNYVSVIVDGSFSFNVQILSTIRFINSLKAALQLHIKTPTHRNIYTKSIAVDDFVTSSFLCNVSFCLSICLTNITEISKSIDIKSDPEKKPIMFTCEVLNMLPSIYLCAPQFCCWMIYSNVLVNCNGKNKLYIHQFEFIPALVIKNRLSTHIVTSAGVVPPSSSRYISQITDQHIVFDGNQSLLITFPLKNNIRFPMYVMEKPAIIESNPDLNCIIISPSFFFRNDSAFDLIFRVYESKEYEIVSNSAVLFDSINQPEWISIGYCHKDITYWSAPLSIPISKEFSIKTKSGLLFLIAEFTKNRAAVFPKYVAINESKHSIWIHPSTELISESQAQLLIWRGKNHLISSSLSPDITFSSPINLDSNVNWVRLYSGHKKDNPYCYLTYSIQSKVYPYTIVFHEDCTPPLSIINESPYNYDITSADHNLHLCAEKQVYLPDIPLFVVFKIAGASPFTVSLQFPSESIVTHQIAQIFVKVEISGSQSRITLSNTKKSEGNIPPRFFLSFFSSLIQIRFYDEFFEAGVIKHSHTVSISSVSAELSTRAGSATNLSLAVDDFQVDAIRNYEKFPVIIQRSSIETPFIQVFFSIDTSFSGTVYVQNCRINLSPIIINIEESLVRIILRHISLIKKPDNEVAEKNTLSEIKPRFIKLIHVSSTQIILSLSSRSVIETDIQSVPIILSQLHLENCETFDFSIAQTLLSHYLSDILACIPTVFTSLSLIGNPANLVNHSLVRFKEIYENTIRNNSSIIGSIGKGSLSIVAGISIGALESVVSILSTIERGFTRINPSSQGENNRITDDLKNSISGIVTIPIQEYNENGVFGFAGGIGKGIFGALVGSASSIFAIMNRTGVAILKTVQGDPNLIEKRIEKSEKEIPTITFE